ncbi:hypothetical protein BG842_09480 [Haladaptatus sp. W1]|uniref:hypothetical protein n=1 Tax=Haladaptatus sp. W1 TaxID=1897478 RepID=UPI000849CD02|nr:hypothetical protein [Haladaptatus sp. W1]ODR82934.1 hypothetical protein BG842_09480 [Haladaptatus sp. W1]
MSGRTERGGVESLLQPVGDRIRAVADRSPLSADVAAGMLALTTAGAASGIRIGRNAPTSLPAVVGEMTPTVEMMALLGPAFAAFVLALASETELERAGFLFVAVFGALAAFTPAVAIPALVAIVGGSGLAATARLGHPQGYRAIRRTVVVLSVLSAVVVSLGSATGVLPARFRPAGSTLALVGLACTPVFTRPRWPDWAIGGAVGGLLLNAGLDAPFVTGAATLVGLAAVGTPFAVTVLGVAAGTVTLSSGLRSQRPASGLGAGLLLVAGVPATIPRAIAVVLGVALIARSVGGDAQ